MLDNIQKQILAEVADLHNIPEGGLQHPQQRPDRCPQLHRQHRDRPKPDGTGIDIQSSRAPSTRASTSRWSSAKAAEGNGLQRLFHRGRLRHPDRGGCGIDNCGNQDSEHDGIHRFQVGKNAPCPLCGKALRPGQRPGYAHPEPRHRGAPGREQLDGDGDGPDQGRRFHRPQDGGRPGRRRAPGGARAPDDPRPPDRHQRLQRHPERRGLQRRRGLPLGGPGPLLPEV